MTMNTAKFEKLPDRLPPVNTVGWIALDQAKFIWLCFEYNNYTLILLLDILVHPAFFRMGCI